MDKEFGEYDDLVHELADFIERNKGQWSSSDRLSLQLEHAKVVLWLWRTLSIIHI